MPRKKPTPRRSQVGRIFDVASRFFEEALTAPSGVPARMWAEAGPWIGNFVQHGAARWLPHLTSGAPCLVPSKQSGIDFPCTSHAISPCAACGRTVCIHHAMVDQFAGVVCYPCIAEIMALKGRAPAGAAQPGAAAAPPPAESADRQAPVPPDVAARRVDAALRVFGLERGASWEAIEKRKRKLLADNHPDKGKTPALKEALELRYKAVSAAYMDLDRFYRPTLPKESAA